MAGVRVAPMHRLLPALLAGVILITGCGAEEKKPAEPVEFEETLGFSGAGIIERQSRVEGEIRDCMKAQGFDYVQLDPLVQERALTGKALTEEEFIKQFGDGVSTLFDRGFGREQTNPNDRIRNSLSAADRAAYDRALGGENPAATFAEAVDSGDFAELGGCTKEASEAEFGGAAVVTALIQKLDELDDGIGQDQRMVKRRRSGRSAWRRRAFRYDVAGRHRGRPHQALPGDRREGGAARRDRAADPTSAMTAPRWPRCSAKRSTSVPPTSSARTASSTRWSGSCARSTRPSFARRTGG